MPPCFATVSTSDAEFASSFSAKSIGNSATACNAMRPFHVSRISANSGHEIGVCFG